VLVAAAAEPASFHLPSRHPLGCHIIDPSFLPSFLPSFPSRIHQLHFPFSLYAVQYIHKTYTFSTWKSILQERARLLANAAHPKKEKKKHKESLTPTWRMIQILSHFLDLVATGWMDGWMDYV
jgi:hypothetical protein